jgi:hypothetical protein
MDLDKEFRLDETENDIEPREIPSWAPVYTDDEESPDKIIRENIVKANQILDVTIDAVVRGVIEPRMIEVAVKAVEAITTAALALNNTSIGFGKLNLEEEMLQIKRKELELKTQQLSQGGLKSLTNNIILTSREEVMKAIACVPKEEIIEIEGEEIDDNDS